MCSHSTPNDNSIPYGYCHCGCGEKTGIAEKSARRDGWVKGEPKRFINHHRRAIPSAVKWDTLLGCYRVELSGGHHALVDTQDIHKVATSRWCATKFGHSWYASRNTEVGGVGLLHRLIMDAPDNLVVDHISGDSLDNRRANLRLCTKAENNRNRTVMQSTNTSGYRGVSWQTSRQRYVAQIKLDRKPRNLGRFLCPIEAAIVRDMAAIAFHGEYAVLNFPHLRELFGDSI